MGDKKSDNMNIQKSSQIHEDTTKGKKNKKKYYNKNSSYYYYKNLKKKKNKNNLEETTTIVKIKDEIDSENNINNYIQEHKDIIVNDNVDNNIKYGKNDLEKKNDTEENSDLIITKAFTFDFNSADELKSKNKIEDLKQAIDLYYYEEEMGKFALKEERKHLKELRTYTAEEHIEREECLDKDNDKKETIELLNNIQPIITFKSEPLPKKKGKKKTNKKDIIDFVEIEEKAFEKRIEKQDKKKEQEDLIITREIDFNFDNEELKNKKVLNELKDAIEDFDRLEMVDETNNSVDIITEKGDKQRDNDNNRDEIVEKKIVQDTDINKVHKGIEDIQKLLELDDFDNKNKKESVFKKIFKAKKKKIDDIDYLNVVDDVKLPDNSIDSDKYLDTQMQPLIEEDKFTQILNKIDLEEKLKEIAESDESSNYLAETFLSFKNSKDNKLQYDVNSKKKIYWIIGVIILIIIVFIILIDYVQSTGDDIISPSYANTNVLTIDKSSLFDECLKRNYQIGDKNEEIGKMEQEITDYISNKYDASVIYQDVDTGYSFGYNSAEVYYAASTIKLLDALYVYKKAAEGEINLDATITYSEKYAADSSLELENHSFGEDITIRDLIKYAITVSDNSAHHMLVAYIGKSKLRDFGNELGATNTLIDADIFGSISGLDAMAYLQAINDFIETDKMYGEELKNLLISADEDYLNISDEIVAAHKYGHYLRNYHNIGIVYDEHPYMIAILSREGFSNNIEEMIRDINKHIYELHSLYYEYKDTSCYTEIYMD